MFALYHDERCSKSQHCYQWLRSLAVPLMVIEYVKQPLLVHQWRDLARQLGVVDPREMMRTHEEQYHRLGLAQADVSQAWQALEQYPVLLVRPIIVYQDQAIVARPFEHAQAWVEGKLNKQRCF